MNSLEKVYGNKLAVWYRRHSLALYVGTTSVGLGYFMNTGAASYYWSLSLGSAVLGYFYKPRSKLTAKDLIVISGCNSGLGYSLALHCRAQGAMVLAGLHNLSKTNNAAVIEEFNERNIFFCDLEITDEESVRTFAQKVEDLIKNHQLVLRALVNNAGVMVFGEFEWQTQNLAEHQVNVNLLGTMRLTRALMPVIRQNGSRIIVVSSHCAHESLPGVSIYGATKAAEHAWASSLRVELGKYGVKVVCFIPGGFVEESNIMKEQKYHFHLMQTHMSEEAKEFYARGNYFNNYVKYFCSVPLVRPKLNKLKILTNPRIYEIFDDTLLDMYPSDLYRCESWTYFIYRILFKITPMWMRDWLVLRFVNTPAWQPNNK